LTGSLALTHLSGMAVRCSNDLVARRKIDALVYQVRKDIANTCLDEADKRSGPPTRSIPTACLTHIKTVFQMRS
jgi:hypothetical protein